MIYIVHGNDLAKSRALIVNQQKKKGVESKTEVSIADVTPQQLAEICAAADLFGQLPFIVFDITGTRKKNLKDYVEVLKKCPVEADIVVLSSKSLTKTNPFLKNASTLKAKVIGNEKAPKGNVFSFLDALFAKNRKVTYKKLATLLKEGTDPFYIMSMIAWGLRNIAYVKWEAPAAKNMSPFVKSKTTRVTSNFTESAVEKAFSTLYLTDKKTKIGEITPDMAVTVLIEHILG